MLRIRRGTGALLRDCGRALFERWECEFVDFLLLVLSDTTSEAAFSISGTENTDPDSIYFKIFAMERTRF